MPLLPLLSLLLACSQSEARLVSGTYEATAASTEDGRIDPPAVTLDLDLEEGTATFTDASGAELASASVTLWERGDWPEGCPTNFSGTAEETATILVASCPDGDSIVLRDDGEFGGGGPCVGSASCVEFE
jgi:hypothetical protein